MTPLIWASGWTCIFGVYIYKTGEGATEERKSFRASPEPCRKEWDLLALAQKPGERAFDDHPCRWDSPDVELQMDELSRCLDFTYDFILF